MSSMKQLSGDTVRLITSTQVITSVYSVVKELIENALDANADNIDVKLENHGFDRIEVRDNGVGITPENALYMAQKHYTSKISCHEDLEALATYGFRGEALGSLCAVSNVGIVTKTKSDVVSHLYTMDHHGKIESFKPSHLGNGTTVTASNLFKNIPVRRQYYSNPKCRREELKKVEELLMAYGAIRHDIRVCLSHNKKPVWQKNKTSNQKSALLNTWGGSVMKQMTQAQKTDETTQVTIEAFLPKPNSDLQLTTRALPDRCWISVNNRPVTLKEIEKTVKQYYCGTSKQDTSSIRHLVMCVFITMPTNLVDVNLEPNKTTVLLQNSDAILSLLTDLLQDVYGPLHGKQNPEKESENPLADQAVLDDSTMEDLNSSADSLDHIPVGARLNLGQNKQQNGSVPANRLGMGRNVAGSKPMSDHERVELKLPSLGHFESDFSTNTLSEIKPNEHEGVMELKLPSLSDFKPDATHSLSEMKPNEHEGVIELKLPPPGDFEPDVTDSLGDIEPNVTNIDMATPTEQDKLSSRAAEKDFTNDQDLQSVPPSQPKFDLMDASLDLFNNSAIDTTCTNEPVNAGIHSDGPDSLPISETRTMNVTKEGSDTDQSNDGVAEFLAESTDLTDIDWSKGVGLKDSRERPIAPSVLLVPGMCPENKSNMSTHTNVPTNQREPTHLNNSSSNQNADSNQQNNLGDLSANGKAGTERFTNQNGSPGRSRRPLESMSGQATLYDLIGSKAVKRPQEAFDLFSKEIKPKVVKDYPTFGGAAISALIEKKWEELTEDEKMEYQRRGQKDADRYEEQVKTARKPECERSKPGAFQMPARKKTKKLEKLANQNLIDEMLSSQGCKPTNRNKVTSPKTIEVKEVDIDFDLKKLKHTQAGHSDDRVGIHSKWKLIGQVSSNNLWLAVKEHQLLIINQYRIEETLLYNRLMATHILPVEQLDVPVMLNSSKLGGNANWVSLLSLQSEVTPPDPDRYYVDDRLKSNGFHIKQTTDIETSDVRLELIAMTTSITYYGIDDLREILDNITQGGSSLTSCRPLKITNYLQGEAMRMARNLSADLTQEEISDIVSRMDKYLSPRQQTSCLHGKPYLHVLHDLNDNKVQSLE